MSIDSRNMVALQRFQDQIAEMLARLNAQRVSETDWDDEAVYLQSLVDRTIASLRGPDYGQPGPVTWAELELWKVEQKTAAIKSYRGRNSATLVAARAALEEASGTPWEPRQNGHE